MDNQKTIDNLVSMKAEIEYESNDTRQMKRIKRDTINEAISALKKQIPKKPKINRDSNVMYCPICERKVRKNYDLYCSGCGWAIDWSEN